MQIKAAISREKGAALSLEKLDIEDPRDSEVLVRVVATGVCHTDIVVRDGMLPTPQPVVLGHEGAGIVEKVGKAVTKVAPGDHVVMTFNSCGHCPSCEDGTSGLSQNGKLVHGNFFGQSSFASHALCHQRNVVKVPKDVNLELMGPLACGIQTGAGAVLNALQVSAGKTFAVFGTGSVGLSAVMAAKVAGAKIIVAVDTNDERLAFAKTVGATHTINPKQMNATETLMGITGIGLDFALDTTGIASVIRDAVMSLANRGTCGILGASPMGSEIKLDEVHFMSGGRRLMGIVEGSSDPDTFIPQLVELHRKGQFPFDRMVRFYSFDQINEAIHDSETGKSIKPILRMA
jgi:aryl-alcohol dehydrogenase